MALALGRKRYDEDLEVEGVWFGLAWDDGFVWWPDDGEEVESYDEFARVKVARAGNPVVKAEMEERAKPYRQVRGMRGRDRKLPDEVMRKVLEEAAAHGLLKDWEGVEIDGKTPKYKPELGVSAFRADPEFLDAVLGIAREFQAFRDEAIEEEGESLGEE